LKLAIPEHRRGVAWLALATAIFVTATAFRFAPVLEAGIGEAIPSARPQGRWGFLVRSDQQWVVWVVSRNARVLLTSPGSFFDAEQCFPEPRSLAFGEPAIAMGLVAAPFWLVTADPIITYCLVVFAMSVGAALAMYWLVVEWTGIPAAGIAGGLLYASSGLYLNGTVHPYSSDTTWLVLALVFTRRWLDRGRWRDALPLAACVALQMATSFYSMVAAVLVAIPFVIEQLWRRRGQGLRIGQLALVLAVALVAAIVIFGPYARLESSGAFEARAMQIPMVWRHYLPGGLAFFGYLPLALAAIGLCVPASRALAPSQRELRPGLALGGLLVAWVASGKVGLLGVDLFGALGTVLPGFASVRLPFKIGIGGHAVLCVLAGIGAAAVVRFFDGRTRRVAEVLAVSGGIVVVGVGLAGSDRTALRVRPEPSSLALHAQLARDGNAGPLFEIPISDLDHRPASLASSDRILLSAFHHRPTSACYPSHLPASQYELEELYRRLPESEAFVELSRLGFTTIVSHPPNLWHEAEDAKRARLTSDALRALAKRPGAPIRALAREGRVEAWELVPASP